VRVELRMGRRIAVLALLATLGLSLSGCGPCGFDLWPRSCRGEPSPQR
jgi:hypothetical protein